MKEYRKVPGHNLGYPERSIHVELRGITTYDLEGSLFKARTMLVVGRYTMGHRHYP